VEVAFTRQDMSFMSSCIYWVRAGLWDFSKRHLHLILCFSFDVMEPMAFERLDMFLFHFFPLEKLMARNSHVDSARARPEFPN